jgi:hypothetical protein
MRSGTVVLGEGEGERVRYFPDHQPVGIHGYDPQHLRPAALEAQGGHRLAVVRIAQGAPCLHWSRPAAMPIRASSVGAKLEPSSSPGWWKGMGGRTVDPLGGGVFSWNAAIAA